MISAMGPNDRSCNLASGCFAFLLGILLAPQIAAAPDRDSYQMPMAAAPRFVSEAIATLPDRRIAVITAMACGSELSFIDHIRKRQNSEDIANNEDIAAEILGKLAWIHQSTQAAASAALFPTLCEFKIAASHGQLCKLFDDDCRFGDDAKRQAAETAFITGPGVDTAQSLERSKNVRARRHRIA